MENTRPNFIDLRTQSQASVSRPLKSPRLHVAGDVPPELSPLDAFALQSRLLAKQLEESAKEGRRMSRLPPLTTASPLILQGRSDYFRSMSQDSGSEHEESPQQQFAGLGLRTEVEDSPVRPMSMHPRMSRIPPTPDEPLPLPTSHPSEPPRGRQLENIAERRSFFGARKERSPSPIETEGPPAEPIGVASTPLAKEPQPSLLPGRATSQSPEKLSTKASFDSMGLAPPRSMFPKRSSSIMSSPLDFTDEPGSTMSASFHSQPDRKLSVGSGMFSPAHFQRSPSISSEASGLPRPSFNFSRPLSRVGTPVLDTPARQTSSDSQTSFILADDTANTPISMHSEGFPDPHPDDGKAAAPSYIYSKFSLPRGKMLQRSTPMEADGQPQASFQWEQPVVAPSNVQTIPYGGHAPPSPPTRPSSSGSRFLEEPMSRPSMERSKLSTEILRPVTQPSPNPSRPSTEGTRFSEDVPRGRGMFSPLHEPPRGRTAMSTTTSDSASTVKVPPTIGGGRSQYSTAPTIADMTAEEHLEKAIALHEDGKLNESTYHLRHAARQGHPTGMLLFALACRHGWGMRPNQKEGVQWLRKAAECASIEIAENEGHEKEGRPVDVLNRKTNKAQFALSIYELGVSHMNGWGIEQDKALALRCFEIAGAWGDVDALAEAGFCYAQGIGCKKNLKTSAKFYRMAEAKGMSMVGNSWIHKSKYNDDSEDKAKKGRSKSRSRNIFGIKSRNNTSASS